jgi:hypothetical protein
MDLQSLCVGESTQGFFHVIVYFKCLKSGLTRKNSFNL